MCSFVQRMLFAGNSNTVNLDFVYFFKLYLDAVTNLVFRFYGLSICLVGMMQKFAEYKVAVAIFCVKFRLHCGKTTTITFCSRN